jgi:glycosyltransferase involved in cell wall biosynthesis
MQMSGFFCLKDQLGIQIITYNRCDYLLTTLQLLEQSPFRDCPITVIDNCSPDDTGLIVARFKSIFSNLTYLCNRINIGGNPNYLKAIELSSSEFTWILCDDDFLDFSDCNDVIEAIESGSFDLVEVGAVERDRWTRGIATSAKKMVEQGLNYRYPLSFFPSFVFRTSLFDSACFCWGYKNIDRLFPQFEFLNKSIRDDFTIYIARKRIVIRNDVNDLSFSPLFFYASWVACCRTIPDPAVRAREIYNATTDNGFFKSLGFWSVMDKYTGDGNFWWRVAEILRIMNLCQRMKYLMVLPLALLPLPFSFWVWVRATLYRLMKVPVEDVPPLRIVERG